MRKLLLFLVLLVVAVVAVLLLAPSFIPAGVYKDRIADAASTATGREVTIGGDVRFSFLPRLEVVAESVTVGNVPGGQSPYLAKVGELGIGIEIWPLLDNIVRVDRFTLADAEINLEVDRSGNGNWQFETASQDSEDIAAAANKSDASGYRVEDVSFNDVRLENAVITYRAADGTLETYEDVNLALALENLDSPLTADGSLKYAGETVELAATLA